MKKKVYFCGVLTALLCVMMLAGKAISLAQHSHEGHGGQPQPAGTFTTSTDKSFAVLMDEAMRVMDNGMIGATMTGNPDHDFAVMMIPHHQGAIDMAKVELLYGKDPVLRRLAQEIIVTQEQEIEVMRTRLKEFKTP